MNYDIYISAVIEDQELIAVVSRLSDVPPEQIRLIADLSELLEGTVPKIILQRQYFEGEYPLFLSFYNDFDGPSEEAFAAQLAQATENSCLIGENSVDPCEWIRISPERQKEEVRVADQFGEDGSIRIVSVRSA